MYGRLIRRGGCSLPFVGIVSMGVVDEKRIAEVAIKISKTTEVCHMATHVPEKRAIPVASAC